jgi:polyhydroxyalkanoate synthesis regulator phasin
VPVETAPNTTETTVTDTTITETLPIETTVPVEPFPDPTDNAPISPPDTPESDLSVVIPETTESPTTTADVPVEVVSEQEITDEVFSQALENLADASEAEVQAIVEELLTGDLSTEQATELVADVALLSAITPEQAQALFEEIKPAELTEEMASVIAEALNDPSVPTEVKEAFEEAINIFGNDGFSDYVPVDSVVSVAVRRTVIATTAILVAIPAPAVRRDL